MNEVVTRVRPRAQYLKQLNTQARRSPSENDPEVVLELKLQTPAVRYWLCTVGLPQPQPGMPKCWVIDYITPEYRAKDDSWSFAESEAYGPQSTTWLQGNDYLQMLTDEYERLESENEDGSNWQITQQMEVTQEEMRQVIAQMEAIIQQKQTQKA